MKGSYWALFLAQFNILARCTIKLKQSLSVYQVETSENIAARRLVFMNSSQTEALTFTFLVTRAPCLGV